MGAKGHNALLKLKVI